MEKRKYWRLFPAYSDRILSISIFLLTLFGAFMIVSAEMSRAAGDNSFILKSIFKQGAYVAVGFVAMSFFMRNSVFRLREFLYRNLLLFFGFLLLVPRAFSPLGGAYAWIRLGGITIQPSEFAKVFIILYFARLLGKDEGAEKNIQNFQHLMVVGGVYAAIIVGIEKDFGSALVLAGIAYILLLTSRHPGPENYRRWMMIGLLAGIVLAVILLSPFMTNLMMHSKDYRIRRFLASANPFLDAYGSGYHLIMSLVSFANGGLFGLGYGNSIHKYMNFANTSSDFILAIIIEELGVVLGMIPLVIMYGMIFFTLIRYSFLIKKERSRLLLTGVFMYFVLHFVLNVGGVSGFIPLTGVPLLVVSSGGTSLVASLSAIGMAQAEIISYRKEIAENANHFRNL